MAKSSVPKPVEELTYETAFAELQEIVATLEGEPRSLESSMSLFERGQALVKRCSQLLDKAELKVRQLSGAELDEAEDQ
jgi:exodeoxyribonuclease VII small subunit